MPKSSGGRTGTFENRVATTRPLASLRVSLTQPQHLLLPLGLCGAMGTVMLDASDDGALSPAEILAAHAPLLLALVDSREPAGALGAEAERVEGVESRDMRNSARLHTCLSPFSAV